MVSWSAKDPAAVLDYVYRIPLDAGDSIASIAEVAFTQLSGTAVIGAKTLAAAPDTVDSQFGQALTVFISGGEDGETDVFQVEWTTAAGRTPNPAIITLPIVTSDLPALALTGYAKPLPGHLQLRYPAFAAVDTATVQYWLTDAERYVDQTWIEGDYAAGLMAMAAHNMALSGLDPNSAELVKIPTGVNRFRSGSFDMSFTDQAANARSTGDMTATRYGQEYVRLLRASRGGPLAGDSGTIPALDDIVYPTVGYPYGGW